MYTTSQHLWSYQRNYSAARIVARSSPDFKADLHNFSFLVVISTKRLFCTASVCVFALFGLFTRLCLLVLIIQRVPACCPCCGALHTANASS